MGIQGLTEGSTLISVKNHSKTVSIGVCLDQLMPGVTCSWRSWWSEASWGLLSNWIFQFHDTKASIYNSMDQGKTRDPVLLCWCQYVSFCNSLLVGIACVRIECMCQYLLWILTVGFFWFVCNTLYRNKIYVTINDMYSHCLLQRTDHWHVLHALLGVQVGNWNGKRKLETSFFINVILH